MSGPGDGWRPASFDPTPDTQPHATAVLEERRPELDVVVVSWNTRDLLRACLASLERHPAPVETRVWVVDNASTDGSAEMVAAEFPDVRLIENDRNRGFAAANNQALERSDAPWLLLLNPDAEVTPGALGTAFERVRQWRAVVAARLLNPDGTLQHSCFRFPHAGKDLLEALYLHRLLPRRTRGRLLLGGYWPHDEEREVEWAVGAFLFLPREAVDAAGPLPEEYALFGEDMEWCWRLRETGWPVRYVPDARVVHHGNRAAGQRAPEWRIRRTHAARRRFVREHRGRIGLLLHRAVELLGYGIRAALFTVMGLGSPRRAEQGREYRRILRVVAGREGGAARDREGAGGEGEP